MLHVPRLADDTIDSFEARIHETEHKLYPEVLDSLGGIEEVLNMATTIEVDKTDCKGIVGSEK